MKISSLIDLEKIAEKIRRIISKGDVIFLYGEIGVGKTTFVRSLIHNYEIKNKKKISEVLSPTFNLLYEYDIKNLKVMHYDLYRIKNNKELDHLGIFKEEVNSIKIIEWPEIIKTNVANRLELRLNYSEKENEREFGLVGYGKWKNFKINEL